MLPAGIGVIVGLRAALPLVRLWCAGPSSTPDDVCGRVASGPTTNQADAVRICSTDHPGGFAMRQLSIRSVLTLAIVAIVALVMITFGSAHAEPRAHASEIADSVTGKEFTFKLATKSVARPGKVTFNFGNAGEMRHDFKINGKKTPLIKPGKTATLAVTFTKKGKYAYLCTVPGHAAAGMRGSFTVR